MKKESFQTESLSLKKYFIETLNISGLENIRLIQVYDVFNIEASILEKAEKLFLLRR
nr:hypothetical protein [endosymbiont 'TC1' of Trimyema compressum]